MNSLDIFLTIVFALEATSKSIVFGFYFCGSTSYIKSGWNILDFSVVIIAIISLSITSLNVSFIKILRLLKILRSLRIISRNAGLKISLRALAIALPGIMNVCIVSLIFYIIFGVIGVNYFKGRYYYCEVSFLLDTSVLDNVFTKWDCINYGGLWYDYYQNFNDIKQALMTLFEASTTVDWAELMYRGANSVGIDMAP